MAQIFISNVYRTHGARDTIVSDRGPQFYIPGYYLRKKEVKGLLRIYSCFIF